MTGEFCLNGDNKLICDIDSNIFANLATVNDIPSDEDMIDQSSIPSIINDQLTEIRKLHQQRLRIQRNRVKTQQTIIKIQT